MLRSGVSRFSSVFRSVVTPAVRANAGATSRAMSHANTETDEQFDARYVKFFDRPDIDHWECRKAMNDLSGMDLVPDPKIIISALKACRRLNDYALAIRFFEVCKDKCGSRQKEIYPYLLQECGPIMCELGIETPEELGYDKPELALKSVFD